MSESAAFRNALRAAGQPWSRWGIRIAGGGIVALLALQIAPVIPYALYALIASVGVIAVGWVLLIVAFVKRRRWSKIHLPSDDIQLTDAP